MHWIVLALFFCFELFADSRIPCPSVLNAFVFYFQSASAGLGKDYPGDVLKGRYPDLTPVLEEFEDQVVDLLLQRPQERDLLGVGALYGLTALEMQDVLNYYVLRFFRVDPAFAHPDVKAVLQRRHSLYRDYVLGGAPPMRRSRLVYYLVNLTHKSIPEFAADLEVPEPVVSQQLAVLGISTAAEFSKIPTYVAGQVERIRERLRARGKGYLATQYDPRQSLLEQSRALISGELSVGETAEVLEVGKQALAFALEYARIKRRQTRWNRLLGPSKVNEHDLVRQRYRENWDSQTIADEINRLAEVTAEDPQFRTRSSVLAHIVHSNWRHTGSTEYPRDIPTPDGEGFLKKNGMLVPENVAAYLSTRQAEPLKTLAHSLGVKVVTLKSFLERHPVPGFSHVLSRERVPMTHWGTSIETLSAEDRRVFIAGVLSQVKQSVTGWSSDSDTAVLNFAATQVADAIALQRVQQKIRALSIRKTDYDNARAGQGPPGDRLYEAFALIAAEKSGSRPGDLSESTGVGIFGLSPVPKPAELSEAESLAVFMDPAHGFYRQFMQNANCSVRDANVAIEGFVRAQFPDDVANGVLQRIKKLHILEFDFASAHNGTVVARSRLFQAFLIIAEVKSGVRPMKLSEREGTQIFQFRPILPLPTAAQLKTFRDPKVGLLAQFRQNLQGASKKTDQTILALAKAKLGEEVFLRVSPKLENLNLIHDDGGNAENIESAAARLHEAFMVMAEELTSDRKRPLQLTQKEGESIFGFAPIFIISEQDYAIAVGSEGVLTFLGTQRGWKTSTDVKLRELAQKHTVNGSRQKVLARLAGLSLGKEDLFNALSRKNSSAGIRILEALLHIAHTDSSTPPRKILTLSDARAAFSGW